MKKFYSIIALAAVTAVSAQNLIQNGSFEAGLAPWAAGTTSTYTAPTIATGAAQDGTNFADYSGAGATTGFYQDVPVQPNTTYTLSFYYKSTGDGSDTRLWSNFKDAAGTVVYLNSTNTNDPLRTNNGYLPNAANWTNKSVTFTTPANVTTMTVAVRAYGGATVAAFDNFVLVQGSTLATAEIKANNTQVLVKNTSAKSNVTFGVKASDVKFYNMGGQVVKTVSVKADEAVNVEDLQPGMYIVTATVNGQPVSQKILKK